MPPAPAHGAAEPYSARRWDLLLPHQPRLIRMARRRVVSLPDAEDVVQEALLRAAGFRTLDGARVGQFLTATVLRLCVDQHRRRLRAERTSHRSGHPVTQPAVDEWICDQALGSWLLSKVHTLEGNERRILLARAAGMSTREAAADLAISPKTAERAFTRGRARLIALSRG